MSLTVYKITYHQQLCQHTLRTHIKKKFDPETPRSAGKGREVGGVCFCLFFCFKKKRPGG